MNTFKQFITEEKNTHMRHIEDSVIYGGVNGARQAINALRELRNMLQGHKAGETSVKWDGAPAVFAGTDPSDGQFFVAKKGIFNKNPKVYKTNADIDADTSGDLNAKLKQALKYLPELGIKGVIQGDFLYSRSDLKREKIDGESYVTFHPNTIVYAVSANIPEAKIILSSKIGIVWHTTYTGKSFETMSASYGVNVAKLRKSKNVWSQDAMLRDLTKATMTKKETDDINMKLSEIGKLFNQISGSTLRELETHPRLSQEIETYNNTFVRAGAAMMDPKKHTTGLINWIRTKYQKEIDKRSTEKGKSAQIKVMQESLDFFSPRNRGSIEKMFQLQRLIVDVKLKLIKKLNDLGSIGTFVKTTKGFKVTGAEGFVAIDKLKGGALKLVDRMEFSYNNFSPNVLKGWQSAARS